MNKFFDKSVLDNQVWQKKEFPGRKIWIDSSGREWIEISPETESEFETQQIIENLIKFKK